MKYFFATIISLAFLVLVPLQVHAASVAISNVPLTVAQQQEFYVDVTVDPQGTAFNAVQGTVVFSDNNLSFVRAETGSSNITFFITPPTVKGNTITFSGIIPGGFNGLINPVDAQRKQPAEIMRLVFMGKAAGEAQIIATNMMVANNDGQGTLQAVPDQNTFLSISTTVAPSVYIPRGTKPPLITASIIQDPNLYNGRYTLIFNTVDKQSGIDHVEVKEGNNSWITVQSPYLLRDQGRRSTLLIRAFDVAGNTTVVTIPAIPHTVTDILIIAISIIVAAIILYVIKKKYIHHFTE